LELPQSFGEYQLLKALGRGATGDVFLARPHDLLRRVPSPVVIKRLHGRLTSDADFVRRFRHEAELAVLIDSPHLAKVFDAGVVGETLYIALEYVAGWPLTAVLESLRATKTLPSVVSAIALISGALEGLRALHEAKDVQTGRSLGIVHRDISPKNIMLGEDGEARLIDLGLGKSNIQDWKTRTGTIMGTLGYMPPEQVSGERVDQRADLYAIGAVFFELLTLEPYLERGPMPVMLRQSLVPPMTPPSQLRADLPAELDAIVLKMLAPDREQRFASAKELLSALREVSSGPPKERLTTTLVSELMKDQLEEERTEITRLIETSAGEEKTHVRDDKTAVVQRAPERSTTSRSTLERGLNAFALLAMLLIGIVVGRVLLAPDVPIPLSAVESPISPIVAVPVPPQITAHSREREELTGVPSTTTAQKRIERREETRVVQSAPVVVAPKEQPAQTALSTEQLKERTNALLARTKSLRAVFVSLGEDTKVVDQLLSRLLLDAGSKNLAATADRLREIEVQLALLEARQN
jgi:serine/threonine-protein kinase